MPLKVTPHPMRVTFPAQNWVHAAKAGSQNYHAPPMERQRGGWTAILLLLLAAAVGRGGLVRVAQAQSTSADCTVTITQASNGRLLSEVVCTGDAEPNVTMWNHAWLNSTAFTVMNHTATYSWNGELH